ncbi:multicopper oxidase domain-containing protein [Bradyrhizobium sp.]|uniref:multicopper oxidase family protein n=1 Tax=Bradyrhizobium sp. TaxID=376 RepID=UPI0025BF73D3|nr:multicopper oxidase domain-containing protein [Bradyrhizobium sp.]
MTLSRRSVLAGAIGAGAFTYAGWTAGDAAVERQPLRIPPLVDARKEGNAVALRVQAGATEFFPGRASASLGYSGGYLGPSIRIYRGDNVEIAVTNTLKEDTTVHWHGLLIPAELDGGPHQIIVPGDTWRPRLPIRQPAATLFYHSHIHGRTGAQVYSGLAGLLLVTDEGERALALPSEYGVDDLPVVIQDRQFDDGLMVVPQGMMTMMQGRRGNTILANGTPNATARVPNRLVRLRLVNGSNARIYDLSFGDNRAFHWIASEGGLLDRPISVRSLTLAPGERGEVLVDFSNGQAVSLKTAPDTNMNMPMMIGPLAQARKLAKEILGGQGEAVLQFVPVGGLGTPSKIPERLVERPRADPSKANTRRRFVLGMGGMMGGGTRSGGGMVINGRPFDMNRIDEDVRLGETEIWEVSGEMMSHPFHIHGVQFEVLSRNGGKPILRDTGARDTVLVKEPVELLVHFDQPAEKAPFMYHCHILEHEDNGMMGQFRTI